MRGRRWVAVTLAALVGSVGITVPAGAATAGVVPSSIPTDCSRDVTAALLAWIATVPDGSTLEFTANACYRVDGTLRIRNRRCGSLKACSSND